MLTRGNSLLKCAIGTVLRLQTGKTVCLFYLLICVCGLIWALFCSFADIQAVYNIYKAVEPTNFSQKMSGYHNSTTTRKRNIYTLRVHVTDKKDGAALRGFNFPESQTTTPMVVSCPLLFSGNTNERKQANVLMRKHRKSSIPFVFYLNLTKNCRLFKRRRSYITSYLTEEERDFPVAYSMMVYKDLEQVERLLRAIYRPQNLYCIHVDLKVKTKFRETLSKITDCFDNVFITKRSIDVRWGTFSVLEPELLCMSALWKYKTWKYFINLTGQEFPLRTNAELVKILKSYNGSNDIQKDGNWNTSKRWAKAGRAPAGIQPVKGSLHIAANRHFVDYVLHNDTAKKLLDWCKETKIPDETFFTSLHFNQHLGILGSDTGEPQKTSQRMYLARFKNWHMAHLPCKGKHVRHICIFSVGDLPLLMKRPELFANKFHLDFHPLVLDCMEELIYNRTRDGYLQTSNCNTTFYDKLPLLTNTSYF